MSDGESDDGKRASKKRKASRACDRCNTQHQPCDNASPKCSICERAGADCTYNRPIRKRGPRTGYTAQHGERLWGLVLRANPGIEDLVLQILANDTYGDTGISNADYFKNNDHQPELVNRFNESRIGKFVQNGDLADLQAHKHSETSTPLSIKRAEQPLANSSSSRASSHTKSSNGAKGRVRRDTLSSTSKVSAAPNPHGAPQNPGDIYLLSEDIRRRVSRSDLSQCRQHDGSTPQGKAVTPAWQNLASPAHTGNNSAFSPGGINYEAIIGGSVGDDEMLDAQNSSPTQLMQTGLGPTTGSTDAFMNLHIAGELEFDFPDTNQWYESIPTETLLNLGFTAGEGMAEDFLNLCENPDPIETVPPAPISQNEDEEEIWRRLVMKGRFL